MRTVHSESTEMYLVTIYRMTTRQEQTTIREIAIHLGVALSSASEKVRVLTEQGYVSHEWREGVSLTETGQRVAMQVLRRNRLATTFLVDMVGYRLSEAQEDACDLEHAISDRLAERLEKLLGNPVVDPYGQPIPTHDGTVIERSALHLIDIPVGSSVTIQRLDMLDPERLDYLQDIGLVPGTHVTVTDIVPFEGPLMITFGENTIVLARMLAEEIAVVIENEEDEDEEKN